MISTRDVIYNQTDSTILKVMKSSATSLSGGDIIDEDNLLFYVDSDLETINNELKDYITDLGLQNKPDLNVYYRATDGEYYAIFLN